MIASVLLAASTVAIAGAMTASYAHDEHAAQRAAASQAGRQLMDEVAALPMSSSGSNPSMADYNGYSDTASTAYSGSVMASRSSTSMGTTASSSAANTSSSSGGSGGSGSNAGLVSGVVTSVTNVVGGLLGASSSNSGSTGSGSSSTGSGSGSSTANANSAVVRNTAPVTTVRRSLTIQRRATVNGPVDPNGDLALLRLTVTDENGTTRTFTRLVSSAEAEANR